MLAFAPLDAAVGVAYHLVLMLGGGAAAIVVATAALRLLLLALTIRQVRAERARAALAPRLAELRERYGDDPAALARETLALHRAENVSPFAGLLPALAQAPFFLVLYRLFLSPTVHGAPNALLSSTLFAVPLGERWITGGLFTAHDLVFGGLLGLLLLLAWWTARRMRGSPPLLRLLPFGTVLFGATLPLAAGLYLVTTTAWTALESLVLRRDRARPDT